MEIRSVALKNRPEGIPKLEDFQVITQKLEPPKENEIQVRNVCMSVDPYMRGRMVDRKSYVPPFQIGEVLTGGAIGRVIESNHPDLRQEILSQATVDGGKALQQPPRESKNWEIYKPVPPCILAPLECPE